jgi:hypothetical protein
MALLCGGASQAGIGLLAIGKWQIIELEIKVLL